MRLRAVERRPGEREAVPWVAELDGLVAHGRQGATGEHRVVGVLSEAERLDVVPLRDRLPAGVLREPTGELGEFAERAEHVRVGSQLGSGHGSVVEERHDLLPDLAAAEPRVEAPERFGHVSDQGSARDRGLGLVANSFDHSCQAREHRVRECCGNERRPVVE
jgi:hypothetical protein